MGIQPMLEEWNRNTAYINSIGYNINNKMVGENLM